MKYFEIDMESSKNPENGTYSVCIKGIRKPTVDEVKQFCKADMENFGCDTVTGIYETTLDEARNFYDMENEMNFPVFGMEV